MIRSLRHRGLKRLFERDDRSGIRPDLVDTVQEILTVLDDAATPQGVTSMQNSLQFIGGFRGDLSAKEKIIEDQ